MCREIRYRTEHDAQVALVGAVLKANRGSSKRRERRAYHCPTCDAWHLTSQPYKPLED